MVGSVAAAVAAALILFSSCGLEQYPDLLSSPDKLDPVGQSFQFRKTVQNGDPVSEEYFLGFELYYKIYAFGDVSSINADVAAIGSQDDLAARLFRRLHAAADKVSSVAKPLVPIAPDDRTLEILLSVDFSGDLSTATYPWIKDSGSPALSAPVDERDIRRDVTKTDTLYQDQFKDFVEFEQLDLDIKYNAEIWNAISVESTVTLVLYVVSYGKDVLNNREIYSRPVWLGEISVIFKPKP